MQSRISFFNATLFRKNLTRFWPLWGMASFVGSLFPLAMLMELLRYGRQGLFGSEVHLEMTSLYYNVVAFAVPVISLAYAVLCAMTVWSYLYNARSVGLMHTLPMRREGLFATGFLSGMAMMLIPYAVTGGLCVLISLVFGFLEPVGLLVTILAVLGHSFFYFATATLAAFIVGNIFALPALYFLLHFLAVMLDWLLGVFAQGFIFGLSGGYTGAVEWLSPTVYLMRHIQAANTYKEVFVRDVEHMYGGYYTRVLADVQLENGWLIAVYALVGVVCLALAWLLYRRRSSETAGDVVSVGFLRPVFRYGVAALAALLGGIVLYEMFWQNFQRGDYYEPVPMTVCMLVAGVIGYYGASMLLAKSLKVFRKSLPGLAAVAVGCAVVCGVLHLDALGISTRVPQISEIDHVTLYVADNNYTFYPGENDALLEQVRAVHAEIAADADYIKNTNVMRIDAAKGDMAYNEYVRLNYYLANGEQVSRHYSLPISRVRIQQDGTYDAMLDQLVNGEAMKAKRLHLNDEYQPDSGYLYLEKRGESLDMNSREAAAVLEAVGKDMKAGTWGNYNWFSYDRGGQYAIHLSLEFARKEGEDIWYDGIDITVRPAMTYTVQCLLDLNLATAEDMVTYAQLYPEEYVDEMNEKQMAELYGAYAMPATSEAASIGIIGGADGPTTVMVTGG